jgi:hypothetical protein
MANVFKNSKLANVSNSSPGTAYTCPAATTAIILSVLIANKNAAARTVTLTWTDDSDSDASTTVLNETDIPGDSTLYSESKIVLEAGDILKALASAASSLDVTVNVMQITA